MLLPKSTKIHNMGHISCDVGYRMGRMVGILATHKQLRNHVPHPRGVVVIVGSVSLGIRKESALGNSVTQSAHVVFI